MRILIDYARADGVVELAGMILTENRPMQALVRRLGFSLGRIPDDYSVVMSRLQLDDQA
jgi:acetyltransferase